MKEPLSVSVISDIVGVPESKEKKTSPAFLPNKLKISETKKIQRNTISSNRLGG